MRSANDPPEPAKNVYSPGAGNTICPVHATLKASAWICRRLRISVAVAMSASTAVRAASPRRPSFEVYVPSRPISLGRKARCHAQSATRRRTTSEDEAANTRAAR
jgi:hypothetical protein